ncbi:glycoside hydrolase family 20 protein [Salinimicrobium sp. 3283s]|uniref:beta-N-acetylhexosaminidase n=1 Tax=Salinimicrobium sp. 3283s TaxID=3114359 RepID=UPI0031EC92B4
MKKLTLTFIVALVHFCVLAQNSINIIPAPQQWNPTGSQIHFKAIHVKFPSNINDKEQLLLNRFKLELIDLGIPLIDAPGDSVLNLEFDTAYLNIHAQKGAYRIELGMNTAIKADSYNGLVHATRTLLQLFSQANQNGKLSAGTIIDFPTYEKRMLMIDVARKFFTVDELKDFIRIMAWVKMNELHLHLSDNSWGGYSAYRLESKKYPELTAKDGYYSWEEIEELQDFAASYGITITPEIDSPGHSLAFTNIRPDLKSPWLSPNYLDITNEDTYEFMEEILAEVIPHFNAPDFHLGTDEYRINSIKDDSLKFKIGDTFLKYINHFNTVVKKHGKNARIWSGFENMPGNTTIDNDVIIDMWETSAAKDKSQEGYSLINSSHYFSYIVPGAPYYGVNNKFIYEEWSPLIFSNKKEQNLSQGDQNLLGSKLHIWNDFGPTGYNISEIARLVLPSIFVFSEKMWGTKAYDSVEEFNSKATALIKIPNTSILSRYFTNENIILSKNKIDLSGSSKKETCTTLKNLEYPWSAEITLKRTSSSPGKEALLSSQLATVYTDLEYTFKENDTSYTKRGIAIVRANQTEGDTPLTSHKPNVIIFEHNIPIDKTTHLRILGEKGKTTLYADGKLIGSKNIQTLIPLEFFGSSVESVFQGVIQNIKVKQLEEKRPF